MNDTPPTLAPARPHRTLFALHCSGAGGRAFGAYPALLGPDTALHALDLLGYVTLYEPVRVALLHPHDPLPWTQITDVGCRIGRLARSGQVHEAGRRLFIDDWARPGAWAALPPARLSHVTRRTQSGSGNANPICEP